MKILLGAGALLCLSLGLTGGAAAQSGAANRSDVMKPNVVKPNVVKPEAPTLGAPADASPRTVATLLFDTPQWSKAPVGTTITYDYAKKTTEAALGPSLNDTISLKLEKAEDDVHRSVEVKMFSGANAKPAGPFESTAQNPVLLLMFEENVQELGTMFKANPRYLKNAIRKAWRDDAKIEDTQVTVDGRQVPGTRITVAPFVNLPEKDKMMGLDTMTYVVEVADSVPGNIARIDIHAPANGTPKLSEVLTYKSATP